VTKPTVVLEGGDPIDRDATYAVAMTDYMYTDPTRSALAVDPIPYETGLNYRDPAISWAERQDPEAPIEEAILEAFSRSIR